MVVGEPTGRGSGSDLGQSEHRSLSLCTLVFSAIWAARRAWALVPPTPAPRSQVSRLGLGELEVGCACAYVCVRVYVCGKGSLSGDTLFSFLVFNNWILTLKPASFAHCLGWEGGYLSPSLTSLFIVH